MGLYPATINDGTTARTITLRGQVPSNGAIMTEYFEPGGTIVAYTDYKIRKNQSTVQRNNARFVLNALVVPATGEKKPITVNIGLTHDTRHSEADIAAALALAHNAIPDAAARLAFLRRTA